MRRNAMLAAGLAGLALAGCGGNQRQDAHEPSGVFPMQVTSASFPSSQRLAQATKMRIVVQNTGRKTVPVVAVTIRGTGRNRDAGAFARRDPQANLADPSRAVWIVDQEPHNGESAYVNTWTGGALKPGRTHTFTWTVMPVHAGQYTLRYRIAAGLNGKARARSAGGGPVQGTFSVNVTSKPRQSHVNDAGQVVQGG